MAGVDIKYKGSSIATIQGTGSKTLKTEGKYCEGDILVDYVKEGITPSGTKNISSNGTHDVTDYASAAVNVTPNVGSKNISANGTYNASSDSLDGYSQVNVSVSPNVTSKSISANGTYNASTDNADGYDVVTVDVPEKNTLDECFADTLEVANIPSATSVIDNLFKGSTKLINVIMPNVTSIGGSAFLNCTNLALTALPEGITSIGGSAFQNCTNLALTALPEGITNIGNYAFQNCKNLSLTALPEGITSIGFNTFIGCTNLVSIALHNGITRINDGAFAGCTSLYFIDLTAFTDPQAIPTLTGVNAFQAIPATAQFIVANQEMYDAFTTATNWSTYASKFVIEGA